MKTEIKQTSATLYEKTASGRYVPVAERTRIFDAPFPHGQYLVSVLPGFTETSRIHAESAIPEFVALSRTMRPAMLQAMYEANTLVPENPPLTPEQKAAWDAFRTAMGVSHVVFRGVSMADVVDAGIKVLLTPETHE